MNKISSKELAFFSMLETTINLNLIEEKANFEILLAELSEKLDMRVEEIVIHIKRLEKMEIVKIKKLEPDKIVLDLSKTHNKILEVFSIDEIDKLLMEFDMFVKKYDGLILNTQEIKKYSKMIRKMIQENINPDINEIIKEGIQGAFDDSEIIKLEKKLYNLCEVVDEKDLQVVEVVLFCFYNFKKEDNPFIVTLFLASVYKNI